MNSLIMSAGMLHSLVGDITVGWAEQSISICGGSRSG